jgi:hypothetical protein
MTESRIQQDIRKALNSSLGPDGRPRVRVMRNSVGYDPVNRVRYGMVGSPDLIGVLRDGRCFAVEVKSAHGRVSPEQQAWWRAAKQWGVLGGVATSVAEAMALLEDALAVASPTSLCHLCGQPFTDDVNRAWVEFKPGPSGGEVWLHRYSCAEAWNEMCSAFGK